MKYEHVNKREKNLKKERLMNCTSFYMFIKIN